MLSSHDEGVKNVKAYDIYDVRVLLMSCNVVDIVRDVERVQCY